MWWVLFSILVPSAGIAADFDVALGYGQSRDFWQTVQDVQDRTGNLGDIQSVVRDKYGKPDILYSFLDASYAYPNERFKYMDHYLIGTRAEALAGGEISNPISPEIQAYQNTTGIFSLGLRSGAELWPFALDARLLGGMGPEKRLYAQGAEFIDSIPVRKGTLMLLGTEGSFFHGKDVGGDFFITTDALVRPIYFHSTVDNSPSRPEESTSFFTIRWKLQNEWTKEVATPLSERTRVGVISVLGQNPLPFLQFPITWDYQQKLSIYPGLGSVSGIGGIVRTMTKDSLPNIAFYLGYFGGAVGSGFDLQLNKVMVNLSTYGVENMLTPAREKTRLWNASIGVSL